MYLGCFAAIVVSGAACALGTQTHYSKGARYERQFRSSTA
jgi:hypothetical protein